MRNDFAVFITTHGRINNQVTLKTLLDLGYTGDWYIVIDDTENDKYEQYCDLYGVHRVVMFSKALEIRETECCLSTPHPKAVVFARNAVERLAPLLGYKYFMVVDDDVARLRCRYVQDGSLKSASLVGNIDNILDAILEYMDNAPVACATFGFTNTYRSGAAAFEAFTSRNRFCAELFIRNAAIPVKWRANFVEDLITSIDAGIRGDVFLQILPIQLELHMSEGAVSGGMSDAYNNTGRFKFYSLPMIIYPNCVSVEFSGDKWRTRTKSEYAVPKIISGKYKKVGV